MRGLLVGLFLFITVPVFANCETLGEKILLNECHGIDTEHRFEVGVKGEVTLWKEGNWLVDQELFHDWANGESGTYVSYKYQPEVGVLQRLVKWVKDKF